MKKILFILLFIFFQNSFTQNIKGIMVLNDGNKIEGLFKISLNKFVYRKDENSKNEKFGYKEAKYLLLDNEDGTYSKFEFISVKHQKKPILFNVMIEDNLSLYSQVLISPNSVTKVGTISAGLVVRYTSTFYIKRKDEKFAQYYVANGYVPKVSFNKVINDYFTDCPNLQKKVKKGEFKKNDFAEIVMFYNENCASKK